MNLWEKSQIPCVCVTPPNSDVQQGKLVKYPQEEEAGLWRLLWLDHLGVLTETRTLVAGLGVVLAPFLHLPEGADLS